MHNDIAAALRAMLGPAVGIGVTNPRATSNDLWAQERPAMARAVPKRQFEFAAGRRAARLALDALGVSATAIPMGQDRVPVWPAGIAGTIAHCDTVCIAAVSRTHRGIGIDIEPATDLDNDLVAAVCKKPEQSWLGQFPASSRGLHAKRIFCAKEAVYKAQYPLTRQMIGFDAVQITFLEDGSFNAAFQPPLPSLSAVNGRLRIVTAMIVATVVF